MQITRLEEVDERELAPGYFARLVHSEHMTFAYWRVLAGAKLPEHSHPHEQVTHILEGAFTLTVEGQDVELVPGTVVAIPPHARHCGVARVACRILDVFYPVREDYR